MQTFIQNLRTTLEILNWIGGICVAVFAYMGLRQLKIALQQLEVSKKTIAVASARDAHKIAADQVSVFVNAVIPLLNALDEKINQEKVTFFSRAEIGIENKTITVMAQVDKEYEDEVMKLAGELTNLFFALEAFAVYFMSALASEDLAFSSVGVLYCYCVGKTLPAMIVLNPDQKNYVNMLSLYFRWNLKLNAMDIQRKQDNLQKQSKRIYHIEDISPIGTE